ncbi:MurR/RpiR family transcriptional regulator [Alkalibacterium sp. 20]|uniref:MurR/RpiR family transcriptional regulator n=1 Tax=Alkalibacterium sp. 20 TaxID=1798803 RepID=UPI0009004967|nr:MurR/RpiR family transcriptional regulator [Alkalibacterium sp. 20]OJF91608.1 RpiR family transcriptional regulator [Alkalibacterium sp. 20]
MFDIAKLTQGKELSELDQQLLTYILDHMDCVLQKGVRQIAKDNYTSPASVIRLSKKLGYTGFIDLYYHLVPLINAGKDTDKTTETDFFDLERSLVLQHNSTEDMDAFIENVLCLDGKFIFIYAAGFSAITAEYLYKKLLLLGKQVIIATSLDSVGVLENNLKNIGAFVAISKSGETQGVLDKMHTAKKAGVYTVSFTKETSNRLSEYSDLNFKITDKHKLDDRNLLPNTFFPFTLLLIEYLLSGYLKGINEVRDYSELE